MAGEDNFANAVRHRAGELFSPGVQWQRSLWNTGLTLSLNEILEASDAAREGAISVASLKWLANAIHGIVGSDPGSGDDLERKALRTLLTQDLSSGGVKYLQLEQWAKTVQETYLGRWSKAVSGDPKPGRERTARALASHLLDRGFSPKWLRHWLKDLSTATASEIFEEAETIVNRGRVAFELMLVFEQPPPERISRPSEWRDPSATSLWLQENGHAAERQHGGLLLTIEAWDSGDAANQAADVVDRLYARVRVGTREAISLRRQAFLGGASGVTLSLDRTRRAEVRTLERQERLLDLVRSGPVDDALELLSHLISAPPPVAAAGGWSAVESVLSGPGDDTKGVTAERLGYLVACSWPRAELTTLAWMWQKQEPEHQVAERLRSAASNRERSQMFLEEVAKGTVFNFPVASDRLALRRIEKLVANPHGKLSAIQRTAESSFRRLYRQRNLVVHGGQVHGAALDAALRTAAPLVGAGFDRITHAFLTRGVSALQLAAQAQLEIARAGGAESPSLTAMLE